MGTYTGRDKRLQYLFQNGGGGGGTTVIANPQGQATDTLNKLQVGPKIYSIPSGGGGSIIPYHANWIASSSSATNTKLVQTLSLPAGKYIAIGRTPVPNAITDIVIVLSLNNVQDVSQIATVKNQYGNFTFYFELLQQTDVDLVMGSSSPVTWLSQYFARGGMDVIKIE